MYVERQKAEIANTILKKNKVEGLILTSRFNMKLW